MKTHEIIPGKSVNQFVIGQTIEDVGALLKNDFNVDLDLVIRDTNSVEITDNLTLVFNKYQGVLSEVIVHSSNDIYFEDIKVGDHFNEISEKHNLIESDYEDVLMELEGVKGLYLEFSYPEWVLDALIVFDQKYMTTAAGK